MDHLLIAHILPPAEAGAGPRVQTLEEHSRHVAELCADTCRPFGLENTGRLMGWLHDVGKAAPEVQDHLWHQTREKLNHSAAGMRWVWEQTARQTASVRMAGQMIALAMAVLFHSPLTPPARTGCCRDRRRSRLWRGVLRGYRFRRCRRGS